MLVDPHVLPAATKVGLFSIGWAEKAENCHETKTGNGKSPLLGMKMTKKVMLLTVSSNTNFIFRFRYAAFYGKTLFLQKKSNGMAISRKEMSRAFNLTSA